MVKCVPRVSNGPNLRAGFADQSTGKQTNQNVDATHRGAIARLKSQPWAYNTLECYGCKVDRGPNRHSQSRNLLHLRVHEDRREGRGERGEDPRVSMGSVHSCRTPLLACSPLTATAACSVLPIIKGLRHVPDHPMQVHKPAAHDQGWPGSGCVGAERQAGGEAGVQRDDCDPQQLGCDHHLPINNRPAK